MKAWRWLVRIFRALIGPPDATVDAPTTVHRDTWTRPRLSLREWSSDGLPPPMMWKACHPRTRATFKAELTCDNGHAVSLKGHAISADGVVSPSVVCLAQGCDFHDFVRLEGWTAGAI